MSNDKLLMGAIAVVGAGIVLYTLVPPRVPNYQQGTYIPPGGYIPGTNYQNQSNTGMYLNFAGQLITVLGTLVGTLADNGVFTPANEDEDDGTWVMLGPRNISGCACEHVDDSLGIDEIEMGMRIAPGSVFEFLPRCATNMSDDPCPDNDPFSQIMIQLYPNSKGIYTTSRPVGGL